MSHAVACIRVGWCRAAACLVTHVCAAVPVRSPVPGSATSRSLQDFTGIEHPTRRSHTLDNLTVRVCPEFPCDQRHPSNVNYCCRHLDTSEPSAAYRSIAESRAPLRAGQFETILTGNPVAPTNYYENPKFSNS